MKKLYLTAFLLLGVLLGASAQDYYIEGTYEIKNNRHYLNNVTTRGITIDGKNYISQVEGTFGIVESEDGRRGELTQFVFDKAKTDCDNGFDGGFYLQYLLEVGRESEWIDEKEYLQGSGPGYEQKDMLIMLVLDYSTSMLRNDYISKMQQSAVDFINTLYSASPNGNIRVGIIAFSGKSQTEEYEIKGLDSNTKRDMERFINSVKPGINTAFYYAVDHAVDMLEEYSSSVYLDRDKYSGACVVTFTDGLDNESATGDSDLAYINNTLRYKAIMGKTIEFFSIGFTGAEDFSRLQKAKFNEVMEKTSTDNNHFLTSDDFGKIEKYFGDIAKNLIDRWKIIRLLTPQGHNGKKVRWVLRCEGSHYTPDPPKTSVTRSPWFGISAEVGVIDEDEFFGGLNLDMAFSINKTIAIGGRVGVMVGEYGLGLLTGPEVKITFPNNSAVIAGLGGGSVNECGVFYLRAGYKTRKSFFVTTETLLGEAAGFGVGLGFSFGGKQRNR
ncbi:MAG: VWA domain-containing protein [Bacteroidales bacterium]|nr:VWA domain-containing protein [Bacteroidales bacterium]